MEGWKPNGAQQLDDPPPQPHIPFCEHLHTCLPHISVYFHLGFAPGSHDIKRRQSRHKAPNLISLVQTQPVVPFLAHCVGYEKAEGHKRGLCVWTHMQTHSWQCEQLKRLLSDLTHALKTQSTSNGYMEINAQTKACGKKLVRC